MNEFELQEEIKDLKRKLERYELEEVGIYAPKHVLNTKADFGKAIKENLREQKHYSNAKNLRTTTGRNQSILIQHFNFQCSELIKKLNGYNLQSVKLKLKDYANNFINVKEFLVCVFFVDPAICQPSMDCSFEPKTIFCIDKSMHLELESMACVRKFIDANQWVNPSGRSHLTVPR